MNPTRSSSTLFRSILWAVLVGLIAVRSTAQTPDFGSEFQIISTSGKQEKVGENCMVKVFQDSLGYIWSINYLGRLMRYNGVEFEKVKIPYGNNPDIFSSLNPGPNTVMDAEGQIWISYAQKGFFRFNPYDFTVQYFHAFIPPKTDGQENFITGIICDRDGTVWVSTTKNLFRFLYRAKRIEPFYEDPAVQKLAVRCDGGKDHLIFLEETGKSFQYRKIHKKTRVVTSINTGDPHRNLKYGAIWGGKEGTIWEADPEKGIRNYNLNTGDVHSLYKPNAGYPIHIQKVNLIWEAPNGDVWVCEQGLGIHIFPFKKDTVEFIQSSKVDSFSLPGNYFIAILQGKDRKYWAATCEGIGLLSTQKNPFHRIKYENFMVGSRELDASTSRPILKLNDREFMVGTNKGIHLFYPETGIFVRATTRYPALGPLMDAIILTINIDSKGRLWIAANNTSNGTSAWYQYDTELNILRPLKQFAGFSTLPKNYSVLRSYDSFEDELGNVYFLHYTSPNLTKIEQYSDSVTYFNFGGKHLDGYKAHYDKVRKKLWVVTNRMGVFMYDWHTYSAKQFHYDPINAPDGVNLNNSDLFQTKNGDILVNVSSTLFLYDEKTARFSKVYAGKTDELSGSMLEDRKGNIWFTLEKCLVRVDPTYRTGIYFTEKSGLMARGLSDGSMVQDTAGWIYASDVHGLISFHPDSVFINATSPPVYISGLKLFNHPVYPGDSTNILSQSATVTRSITLNYQQNVLTIEYIALNYQDATQNEYAYRLEGFDPDWQYVGNKREVTYTNLAPGTYTFRVKGANNYGVWNEQGATLMITILPPWYRSNLAYFLYFLLLSGGLYAFYRFQLNRHLEKKEAVRLRDLDEFKTKLYTGITHEFRTPLTVILGMAEQATGFFEKGEKAKFQKAVGLVQRNGQQLLRLVNQMLDLASLDAGKLQPDWQQGDVIRFIRYLTESFHSLAETRDISLIQQHETPAWVMDYDPEKLEKIISNLLSNAIKFTPEGGQVDLHSRRESSWFVLQVKDNGVGISKKEQSFVFDRFFKSGSAKSQAAGTGIGLALTKDLVQLMGGTIGLKSEVGEGTVFTVKLPIHNRGQSEAEHRIDLSNVVSNGGTEEAFISKGKSGAPLLLIIEDNVEVAGYLATCLESEYQLVYARDGQEGIELAIEHVPDFIISDVMMPEKSGFEVCQTLKTDARTSHIPIILLTAKADEASRLDGLKRGADAYLTKPFNAAELQIRIEQMIGLRRHLQTKFQQRAENLDTPKPDSIPDEGRNLEEAFLQKLRQEIELLLTKPELDVPLLCRKMGMSRTQLHRKLSAIANMSATQFIRNVRYQKAKHLLRHSEQSISEIAYDVGFSDPAYFTRMFKKEVGSTPSEFREQ